MFLVIALFPHFGAPHFRYTGSDPNHDVWNLGVPIATCIYDSATTPNFFIGPLAYLYAIAAVFGFMTLYAVMVAWNNRHLFLGTSVTDGDLPRGAGHTT